MFKFKPFLKRKKELENHKALLRLWQEVYIATFNNMEYIKFEEYQIHSKCQASANTAMLAMAKTFKKTDFEG